MKNKFRNAIALAIITFIILISYTSYLLYKIIFTKNANTIDLWIFGILSLISLILILTLVVKSLSSRFPNSKLIKTIDNLWDKLSDSLEDGLKGI